MWVVGLAFPPCVNALLATERCGDGRLKHGLNRQWRIRGCAAPCAYAGQHHPRRSNVARCDAQKILNRWFQKRWRRVAWNRANVRGARPGPPAFCDESRLFATKCTEIATNAVAKGAAAGQAMPSATFPQRQHPRFGWPLHGEASPWRGQAFGSRIGLPSRTEGAGGFVRGQAALHTVG